MEEPDPPISVSPNAKGAESQAAEAAAGHVHSRTSGRSRRTAAGQRTDELGGTSKRELLVTKTGSAGGSLAAGGFIGLLAVFALALGRSPGAARQNRVPAGPCAIELLRTPTGAEVQVQFPSEGALTRDRGVEPVPLAPCGVIWGVRAGGDRAAPTPRGARPCTWSDAPALQQVEVARLAEAGFPVLTGPVTGAPAVALPRTILFAGFAAGRRSRRGAQGRAWIAEAEPVGGEKRSPRPSSDRQVRLTERASTDWPHWGILLVDGPDGDDPGDGPGGDDPGGDEEEAEAPERLPDTKETAPIKVFIPQTSLAADWTPRAVDIPPERFSGRGLRCRDLRILLWRCELRFAEISHIHLFPFGRRGDEEGAVDALLTWGQYIEPGKQILASGAYPKWPVRDDADEGGPDVGPGEERHRKKRRETTRGRSRSARRDRRRPRRGRASGSGQASGSGKKRPDDDFPEKCGVTPSEARDPERGGMAQVGQWGEMDPPDANPGPVVVEDQERANHDGAEPTPGQDSDELDNQEIGAAHQDQFN